MMTVWRKGQPKSHNLAMLIAGCEEPEGEAEAAAQIPLIPMSVSPRRDARYLSELKL